MRLVTRKNFFDLGIGQDALAEILNELNKRNLILTTEAFADSQAIVHLDRHRTSVKCAVFRYDFEPEGAQ